MSQFALMETKGDPATAVRLMLRTLLRQTGLEMVFAPAATPYSKLPMPMLISDPKQIDHIDIWSPVSPFNAARQAAVLLRHDTGKRIGLVLRPCEIRALIELTKLNQCLLDSAVIIGIECMGRMENRTFLQYSSKNPNWAIDFHMNRIYGDDICQACRCCVSFQAENADLSLLVLGMTLSQHMGLLASSPAGSEMIGRLPLHLGEIPETHNAAVKNLRDQRRKQRDSLYHGIKGTIENMVGFQEMIGNCIGCRNCRVACPVCYCRECVFDTDTFAHDPEVLLRRADKRGAVKMPTETAMFHLTRLAHIGHACVNCGQCSSVCPADIPIADVFMTVGAEVQALYAYTPGKDIHQNIPYLAYTEKDTDEK